MTYATYLNEIGRVPLLTADQEIHLARRVQRMQELSELDRPLTPPEQREVRRGKAALDQFARANLRLVVSVAKKYQRMTRSMDLMDLVQEGNTGLMRGILKFDPERGYKFSTYAHWWIRQAISRAIRYKDRTIRLPGNIGDMAYTWARKRHGLLQELGRAPNEQELAKVFQVSVEDVRLFKERGHDPVSLNVAVGDDSGAPSALIDLVADPSHLDGDEALEMALMSEIGEALGEVLGYLAPKDREVLEMRWGLNREKTMSLREIAELRGVSREAIRQTLARVHNKVRRMLTAKYQARNEAVESLTGAFR
jgi:RNA polymerase nonessential primary-like sigma factor